LLAAGTLTLVLIGIALGLAAPTARAAQAIALLAFFPLYLLGGGGPPTGAMTGAMHTISNALPSPIHAITEPWLGLPGLGTQFAVLAAWASAALGVLGCSHDAHVTAARNHRPANDMCALAARSALTQARRPCPRSARAREAHATSRGRRRLTGSTVMPMIDVYAGAGTFPDRHQLARDLAAAVMRWEQVPDLALFRNNTGLADRTWVLLTESPQGGWGGAGRANTGADLAQAARAEIAGAAGADS
jgi:hypothetical protein